MTSPCDQARLFHVGIVVADFDTARAPLSESLNLRWKGGGPTRMALCIEGEDREIAMRIAHSIEGPPHIELIETVPDSPWAQPSAGFHHLCYWADEATAACAALEASGHRRLLGRPGSATGYFLSPDGIRIEVIDRPLRDRLSGWLARTEASVETQQ